MSKIDDCNKIISTLTDYEKSQIGDEIINEHIEFINVVYYENEPAGFVIAKNTKGTDDYYPDIKDAYVLIAVSENFRNHGIGTYLVDTLLDWFENSDFEELVWTCDIHNEKSKNLALNSGFTFAWDKDENTKAYHIKK